MQHLSPTYKNILPDAVECIVQVEKLVELQDRRGHGCGYIDFIQFPETHGFTIDGEHKMIHQKPSDQRSEEVCSCFIHPQSRRGRYGSQVDQFFQAWLFFGLLNCVVRLGGEPILKATKLVTEDDDFTSLDTSELKAALDDWHHHLRTIHEKTPDVVVMRCIEAAQVLRFAKRVVKANFSSFHGPATAIPSTAPPDTGIRELCLMVLGETLSDALDHIMRNWKVEINGWRVDCGGWGPSRYVFETMASQGWCERYKEVCRGQMNDSATLLYVTLLHNNYLEGQWRQNSTYAGPKHTDKTGNRCTRDRCHYVEAHRRPASKTGSGTPSVEYNPLGHPDCNNHPDGNHTNGCKMIGPLEQNILDVLDQSNGQSGVFPLLQIWGQGENASISVEPWEKEKQFATISHTWSQGLGNRSRPEIWSCQLDHIRLLLAEVFGGEPVDDRSQFFWLDTLAMPVVLDDGTDADKERRRLRKTAVGMIYHVFSNATHGIVLDRRLLSISKAAGPRTVAIALLSSAWIQRLWTLQEAFVTESLSIALRSKLVTKYTGSIISITKDVMDLSLTSTIDRTLAQNLMGDQRGVRSDDRDSDSWSLLIASAWRSARYREIGKRERETCALATLLGLPRKDIERIDDACQKALKAPSDQIPKERWKLMGEFWRALTAMEHLKHSIPPGMIFLPGKRLLLKGFGWAPETWMSGKDDPYPYPLGSPKYTTTLVDEGLKVRYPGWRIRATPSKCCEILGENLGPALRFQFCADSGLHEWYVAKLPSDGDERDRSKTKTLIQLAKTAETLPELAIIVSRARPGEFQGEVGLLVHVTRRDVASEETKGFDGERVSSRFNTRPRIRYVYFCEIIRRLAVSRVPLYDVLASHEARQSPLLGVYKEFDGQIVGEAVGEDQEWCVDGYRTDTPPIPPIRGPSSDDGKERGKAHQQSKSHHLYTPRSKASTPRPLGGPQLRESMSGKTHRSTSESK